MRHNNAANIATFVGAQAELAVDTDNNRLVVQDGATPGGFSAAKLSEVVTNKRTTVSDAAYAALSTDRMIAYTALSAARTVSLPSAATFPTGSRLLVIDESGACSPTKTITLSPNGADNIEGANSPAVIALAYGFIGLECNGSSGWFVTDQLAAASAPNGANIQFGVIEILCSGMSGATVTAPAQVPANCVVFAVGARVVATITGANSYEVGWNGPGGSATTFGSGLSLPAGSTNYGLIGPTANYSAANLILTATGGNFTAGAVRLSIHYALMNPSAS
jgi:hypothetical protein